MTNDSLKALKEEYGDLQWTLKLIQAQIQSCEQRLAQATNEVFQANKELTPLKLVNGEDKSPVV